MNAVEGTCGIRAAQCTIGDKSLFLGELQEIAQKFEARIICFNADMLAGRRHAEAALRCAVRSFGAGRSISNSLEMEALLYAAGSRQCHIAMSFGPHEGVNRLWVCCYPARDGIWSALEHLVNVTKDEAVEEPIDGKKRELLMHHFAITREECDSLDNGNTLVDLVVERVALLQILR